MKIVLGCDHGGYKTKESIKNFLVEKGYEVVDAGCYSEESVDYPVYGIAAAEKVASNECDYGILVCGTGIGISISANKVKGIRCALLHDVNGAKLTRQHNNANMMALSGRFLPVEEALEIVEAFLTTEYEGGRHQRRLDIISEYEND